MHLKTIAHKLYGKIDVITDNPPLFNLAHVARALAYTDNLHPNDNDLVRRACKNIVRIEHVRPVHIPGVPPISYLFIPPQDVFRLVCSSPSRFRWKFLRWLTKEGLIQRRARR